MKLLLHGDNQVASRKRLDELINQAKSSGQEIIRLNGANLTETDLRQALETQSLFGGEKTVVIERLSARLRSKEKDTLLKLVEQETKTSIVMWETNLLTAAHLKKLASFKPETFKTPATIFRFLDSLTPQSPRVVIAALHDCLRTEATELVLYLTARRISELIIALDKPSLLVQAPWLKGKLLSQAKKFTLDQLTNLHSQLLDLEYAQKTGTNILPLSSELDLLLLNI